MIFELVGQVVLDEDVRVHAEVLAEEEVSRTLIVVVLTLFLLAISQGEQIGAKLDEEYDIFRDPSQMDSDGCGEFNVKN